MTTKVLKIQIGSVFIDGKSHAVFQDAWRKESKDGKTTYYEIRQPIFIQEIEKKEPNKEKTSTDI